MEKTIIDKLENCIREKDVEAAHMLRTGYWLKAIYPVADDIFYVAAVAHDIERCFSLRDGEMKPAKILNDRENQEYLMWHGRRSAEFAEQLLREYGVVDDSEIAQIKKLIEGHSFGGDEKQNALMDADTISFFENNASSFVKEYKDKDKLKDKFTAEYGRLFSDTARKFAQPYFKQAMAQFE
jgi:HD superfamily phosphohydrolase YqeK